MVLDTFDSQKGSNYSTKGKPDVTHPDESEGTDQLNLPTF
jgi:hypothetical protein